MRSVISLQENPIRSEKASVRLPSVFQRIWMMSLLVLLYTSHFVDRIIVAVVAPGIKHELTISDAQFGLMVGLGFAIPYTALTLPFARLVERASRRKMLAIAVLAWSLMTALGGAARSYGQLLACRMAVSVGEAAWTPTATSLIADSYPPNRRASALSILGLGACIGSLIGAFGGGKIAEAFGWRGAFLLVGAPGLLLALLVALTLREPVRGQMDVGKAIGEKAPSFRDVVARLARKPAFVHMVAGGSISTFVTYAIILFLPVYLSRTFGMSASQAGLALGVVSAGATALGQLAGGHLADWLGRRDERWYAWMPAIALFIAAPSLCLGLVQHNWVIALAAILGGSTCIYFFYGPTYAAALNMAGPGMHASAAGILLVCTNVVGVGLGPLIAGTASDHFAAHLFTLGDYARQCPAGMAPAAASATVHQACAMAAAGGLRWSLIACSLLAVVGAILYMIAARTIQNDLKDSADIIVFSKART
jgi:MFS family permease